MADAYLKVKDNGANGLAITREESDVSITDLKSAISEYIEDGYFTPSIDGEYEGVTAIVEGRSVIKLYGTANSNKRFLCLNGQDALAITSTVFSETFPAGYYHFELNVTGIDALNFQYTFTTFKNNKILVSTEQPSATVYFDQPVMLALYLQNGYNYGTSENPTIVTFTAEKLSAVDYKFRDSYKYLFDMNLGSKLSISSGTDYNRLTNPGVYVCGSAALAATMKNCPVTNAHIMLVFRVNTAEGRIVQYIITAISTCTTLARFITGSTIYEWQRITNDLPVGENTPYSRKLNNQITKLLQKATTKYGTLPKQNNSVGVTEYYPNGTTLDGVMYSSVWRDGLDVFRNLTLETYYSALANPASVLYTKDYTDKNVSNAHSWYGGVCSTFVCYIIGRILYNTTVSLINSLVDKQMDSLQDIETGDLLIMHNGDSGHIRIVSDVCIDENGVISGVKVSEMTGTRFITTYYSYTSFERNVKNNNYIVKVNPGQGAVSSFGRTEYNPEIIFERGNNTYITQSDISEGAWFYIPNATTIYYKKDSGDYSSVLRSSLPTKTVNGVTVYNLASCFNGIGNYEFAESETSEKTCLIKMINTGSAVLNELTLTLSGWENCTPKNYYVVEERPRTSADQNYCMNPTEGYVCVYSNKCGEITVSGSSATVIIPSAYVTEPRYKIWIEYDTGVGYKQVFSNLVT